MKVEAPPPQGHVRIGLQADEALQVLHPKAILAYRGAPGSREDKLMDAAGVYRKRKWIRSRLQGPSELLLGLPPGYGLEAVDVPDGSDLLFDFRHVIFYSDSMTLKPRVQKLKTAWITRELTRMRFSGPGTLGILTAGGLASIALSEDQPLYADAASLVAFPESAKVRLAVYGNPLASQHMNVQWELTGRGSALIQTGSFDRSLPELLEKGGFLRRTLRELLPFGGVYIK
ncbi:AIM24 family protein [Paenibacillus pasadenensis]|uniref:AIM24 family protein n=1 Tax=Paenibacillus pasadenensis TaxID=217090 RepID=UPI00203EA932|nr:AIM24 family protein [Paenibacillus pasadenensis]MCM3748668.1 AIM24 family protein [Paenibacillus pasadenensis]